MGNQRAKKRQIFRDSYLREEIDKIPITGMRVPFLGMVRWFRRTAQTYTCTCGYSGKIGNLLVTCLYRCPKCIRLYKATYNPNFLVELQTFYIQHWMIKDEFKIKIRKL